MLILVFQVLVLLELLLDLPGLLCWILAGWELALDQLNDRIDGEIDDKQS